MVENTMYTKYKINFGSHPILQAFVKSTVFKSKKSKVLTSYDVSDFITDEVPLKFTQYMITKVALIFSMPSGT